MRAQSGGGERNSFSLSRERRHVHLFLRARISVVRDGRRVAALSRGSCEHTRMCMGHDRYTLDE